jgi:hypothetical protein
VCIHSSAQLLPPLSAGLCALVWLVSVVHSPSGGVRPSSAAIFRTATSRYTTAEQSTLEDLKCQICLNTLRQCVALEPCGHNFCAPCLSHHLGNSLQQGLQLSCPFRYAVLSRLLCSACLGVPFS